MRVAFVHVETSIEVARLDATAHARIVGMPVKDAVRRIGRQLSIEYGGDVVEIRFPNGETETIRWAWGLEGVHTHECREAFQKWRAEMKAFLKQYPNHCPDCGGVGHTVYQFDPSRAGVMMGVGTLEDAEPCESCEAHQTKPR